MQTIRDDGDMLFLYGNCDCMDLARNMAGLTVLDIYTTTVDSDMENTSSPPTTTTLPRNAGENVAVELMKKYLGGIEGELKDLLDELRHSAENRSLPTTGNTSSGAYVYSSAEWCICSCE